MPAFDTSTLTGLSDPEREGRMYELCASCGHSAQWHIWGPRCLKERGCPCAQFIGSGRDARQGR